MELLTDRAWKKDTYTISRLFVDGVRFYEMLENKDRGLKQTDSLASIQARKVYGETAIPSGVYEIDMDTISQKFANNSFYKRVCGGKVPRLKNVPGFNGVLIHAGNSALESFGCLLPGRNLVKGKVLQSRDVFEQLYKKMIAAHKRGEKITINIK